MALFAAELSEVGVQTRGSMEGGCTLAFDKVKGG